jgi:LysR family glycine cleavage system transcriptional activator
MRRSSSASQLRALQAFSAVARVGSVAGAAEELTVTPSAISHLVRQLQRHLGVVLFDRKGRGLNPTLDGERLASAISPAFAAIDDAVSAFRRRGAELRISMLSSFAVHWLIPRMSRFQALHPDIELLLSASTRIVDLTTEAFDCAIRLGSGGWANVMADELYREELVAVCSPHWLAGRRIRSPKDLARAKLLHSRSRRQDWAHWLKAAGIADFDTSRGPVFETRALAIQAATAQMGVAVVDPRFVEAELAAGQLTAPFPLRVTLDNAYWLVWRPGHETTRPLAAFRRWLTAEIALAPKRARQ